MISFSIHEEKKKQIGNQTAESQGIVAQGNSNPYNTAAQLSRLQMIKPSPHLADVEATRSGHCCYSPRGKPRGIVSDNGEVAEITRASRVSSLEAFSCYLSHGSF